MDILKCPRCNTRFRGALAACPIDGEALVPIQDPLIGRTIAGRYSVEDKIGGGGMGVVYRGRHQVIDREVAIKFLHSRFTSDATSRKRFLGEARAANQIGHENIIDITDFGETEDGLVYLVMEYLVGRSLDRDIAGQPMPPHRAVRIATQIAAGLARAHELDVIHRDVKPANVFLIRRRGDPDFVKLLDFGIARFEREMRITDRGALMGTPEYMAPEQVQSGEASPATDLYALGCVLFEMLVGMTPFNGTMPEVLVKQMREPPPAPSRLRGGLSAEIDAIVLRLLNKDPSKRHRDAYHLVDELQHLLDRIPVVGSRGTPSSPRNQLPAQRAASQSTPPPPDPARPTLHLPTEHEAWNERVSLFRQMLARVHPAGDAPQTIVDTLSRMETTVGRVLRLRVEIDMNARELVSREDELRATRLRIGRALDELASDESKSARALDADKKELTRVQAEVDARVRVLLTHDPRGLAQRTSGARLSPAEVDVAQRIAADLAALGSTHAQLEQIQGERQAHQLAWEDLRFQIAQLKGRLGTLNADSSATAEDAQSRVLAGETQLRAEIDHLVRDTEVLTTYLRSRPEIAPSMRPKRPHEAR
jgi:serine/threonine protein kinase